MRVALHTRLRPGKEQEYDAAHRAVPAELVAGIRAAGATEWTIWRSGPELFHVIECADYERLIADLGRLGANAAWQARMGELVEVAHDYSAGSRDQPLPVVWRL